mmetsp:Transcript_13721/g.21499  ORF Transcript_13721/g.21499 Transcript_13721/m.21499 type:complete len:490 (-) Transcript_13721:95-1564(-)
MSSLELSSNVGDGRNQVDGSTGDEEGGLSREALGGGGVDVGGGNSINLLAVLVESKISKGLVVSGNLLKSVLSSLHGHKDVHLEHVLSSVELDLIDVLLQGVELLNEHAHQLLGVGSGALDGHAEETGVREVRVHSRGAVHEGVLLHKVSHSSAVHALAGSSGRESSGGADQLVHDVEDGNLSRLPGHGLESESDGSVGGLGPGAELTSDVLGGLSGEVVLGDGEELSDSLLDEVDVLLMVLDTGSNNEGLLGGDVVHNELLEHAGVDVVEVLLHAEARHTKGVVSVGSAEEVLLLGGPGVELGEVVEKIVALGVLGSGNVGSEDRLGLESEVDHHLEHIDDIVLDAVTLEVGLLLVEVHGHGTSGHLDHTVVNGLVGVLEGLQVGVLEGKEGSGSLSGLISGSDIHKEAHVHGAGEVLALSQHGEAVGQLGHVVLVGDIRGLDGGVAGKRSGGVVSHGRVGVSALVKGVEDSVEDSGVGSESSGLEGR